MWLVVEAYLLSPPEPPSTTLFPKVVVAIPVRQNPSALISKPETLNPKL